MDGLNEITTNPLQENGEQIAAAEDLRESAAAQTGEPEAAQLPDVQALIEELQPEYREALDPTSPGFDRKQWREAQEQLNAAYIEKLDAPQIGEQIAEIMRYRDEQRHLIAPGIDIDEIREKLNPEHNPALDPDSPDFDRDEWEAAEDAIDEIIADTLDSMEAKQKKGYHIQAGENGEPDAIIIDIPEYNPKLDPDSPDFDIELWKEELSKVDFDAMRERMQENAARIAKSAAQLYSPENMAGIADTLRESIAGAINAAQLVSSIDYSALVESMNTAALNATQIVEESSKMLQGLINSDFIERVYQNIVKLAIELPPEELEALQEEIKEGEKPARDENQTPLFDDDKPVIEERATDENPAISADFIQLFGQPAKKTKRRTPTLDAITEQAVTNTVQGYILQGKATNALTKAKPTKRNTSIDPITGDATIKSGDIVLKIKHYSDIADPRTSTYQLLDAITETLTQSGAKGSTVELPLTTYMEKRGLKDRKETRKQVEEDLETLYNSSISLTESRSGKEQNFLDMRICDAKGIKNGIINFSFGSTFFSLLKGYAVMHYPAPLYKINGKRNPYSYPLGRKITEHKNMNAGKRNENIIAVKTLLKVCEGLPSKKEVAATNRNFTDRIIKPFERDLDALEDILTWEYCHRNGTPLTNEELAQFSFETFESALILTHWKNYPDQTKRLADRQARIDEAKEAGKKKKRGRPPKAKQET